MTCIVSAITLFEGSVHCWLSLGRFFIINESVVYSMFSHEQLEEQQSDGQNGDDEASGRKSIYRILHGLCLFHGIIADR